MDNTQRRAVHPRARGLAWVRRVMTLAVLAAGLWGVAVVLPPLDTAVVGVPTPRLPVTATATFASAARLAVSILGAEWAEGTGVVTGEVDTPRGRAKESVPFTVPRTDVATGSGPLSVSGSGILPARTFSRPGDGQIIATGLTVHFSLLTSGGSQTWLSPFTVSCTVAPGQDDAVASFRILLPPSVPAPPATRGSGTISPTPSPEPRPVPRPTPRPVPGPVTSSPTRPPAPAPTPPRGPSSLVSLLLWPAGIASAGGLGGLAWWLLRRASA